MLGYFPVSVEALRWAIWLSVQETVQNLNEFEVLADNFSSITKGHFELYCLYSSSTGSSKEFQSSQLHWYPARKIRLMQVQHRTDSTICCDNGQTKFCMERTWKNL